MVDESQKNKADIFDKLIEDFKSEILKKYGMVGDRNPMFFEDDFFEAFWDSTKYETFFERYQRNRKKIKKIGQAVVQKLCNELKETGNTQKESEGKPAKQIEETTFRVFIESGSTTASLGPAWVKKNQHFKHLSIEFLTNNLFILNSLLGSETSRVAVTPGPLHNKYLAFIPFSDNDIGTDLRGETDTGTLIEELKAYNQLLRVFSTCDVIYMAASEFGFLCGPFVGSRSNAIFKHAILCNRGCKNIKIVIPASKLFQRKEREDGSPEEWKNFTESLKKTSILDEQETDGTCYPVIDIKPIHKKIKDIKEKGKDRVDLKTPEGSKMQYLNTDYQYIPPAYKDLAPGSKTLDHMRVDLPLHWIDILEKYPDLSILIGIEENKMGDLVEMIEAANHDLTALDSKMGYELKTKINPTESSDIILAEVVLKSLEKGVNE